MIIKNCAFGFIFLLWANASAQIPDAQSILNKTIKYHDPKNEWVGFNHQLEFTSERADGTTKKTLVKIDNNIGYFQLDEEDTKMSLIMD